MSSCNTNELHYSNPLIYSTCAPCCSPFDGSRRPSETPVQKHMQRHALGTSNRRQQSYHSKKWNVLTSELTSRHGIKAVCMICCVEMGHRVFVALTSHLETWVWKLIGALRASWRPKATTDQNISPAQYINSVRYDK